MSQEDYELDELFSLSGKKLLTGYHKKSWEKIISILSNYFEPRPKKKVSQGAQFSKDFAKIGISLIGKFRSLTCTLLSLIVTNIVTDR